MTSRLVALYVFASVGFAQQAVLLDFSDSMAGFAGPHETRLTGLLQRVGNALSSTRPTQFYTVKSPGHRPALALLSINEAAVRFSKPASFGGYSPLRWAINEAITKHGANDLVFFTDGMEDDARVEDVANSLAQYAKNGWSMGIASLKLPFDGNYYAEMKIPFEEFRPLIEQEFQRQHLNAKVSPARCTTSATATCYHYSGPRILLVLFLSKTNSLDRLFGTLKDACSQVLLSGPEELTLFPASAVTAQVEPFLPPASREHLRTPKPNGVKLELDCVRALDSPLTVSLKIGAKVPRDEGTANVVAEVKILERPNWLRKSARLIAGEDGYSSHDIEIVCLPPGLLETVKSPSALLPGTLKLEYPIVRKPRTTGWWIDDSASNPWQFPNRVYHLQEFVAHMQSLATSRQNPGDLRYEISLRSRR